MFTNNSTPFTMPVAPVGNYGGGGGFGYDGGSWIWFILILLIFGWGNGYGYGNGGGGVANNYVLSSDFATIQRQLSDGFGTTEKGVDTIRNGLCDGFYTEAQLINGVNTNIMQGFNTTQAQLADCCCKTQQNIKDTQYVIGNTGAGITNALKDGFCSVEKQSMQTNYNMATQNCATLQAIDKAADRIIEYMVNDKTQTLRDENNALRLAASQQAQNNYIVSQLKPCPTPAYVVPNPYCNCNCGNGYYNGTTIA